MKLSSAQLLKWSKLAFSFGKFNNFGVAGLGEVVRDSNGQVVFFFCSFL